MDCKCKCYFINDMGVPYQSKKEKNMTKREKTYLNNFYNKFIVLLDKFIKSEVAD